MEKTPPFRLSLGLKVGCSRGRGNLPRSQYDHILPQNSVITTTQMTVSQAHAVPHHEMGGEELGSGGQAQPSEAGVGQSRDTRSLMEHKLASGSMVGDELVLSLLRGGDRQ